MGVRSRIRSLFKGPEEFDLTAGSIGKPLFFLSMPIVVTNLFQTAYNLADTFWLGQYNTDALAAISFAFPMVFLLISLGMGISVAGSVLVAQFTGADEEREAEYAASQTVTFAAIAAVILGGVGYVASTRSSACWAPHRMCCRWRPAIWKSFLSACYLCSGSLYSSHLCEGTATRSRRCSSCSDR